MSARPKTPTTITMTGFSGDVAEVRDLRLTVQCDHCQRVVPVAPHHFAVSVPHVRVDCVGYDTPAVSMQGGPCAGNEKRTWRDELAHPATVLAQQHAILDDDLYWEGL